MIEAGHMTKINISPEEITKHYFLSHHAVIKESSNATRLRPIFNASARNSEGNSLNDHLMIGVNLLPDIVLTVDRWRCYRYVFVADCIAGHCKLFYGKKTHMITLKHVFYQL